jgi:hypothetical protein
MIRLFIVENIVGATMVEQTKNLLREFGLFNKMVAFVKDEGTNLCRSLLTIKSTQHDGNHVGPTS